MAQTTLEDAGQLTVADVIHRRLTAFPADVAVREVREWFASSTSHRMALLADSGHYVGSLIPEDLPADLDGDAAAARFVRHGPTVGPELPAAEAYATALTTDAQRVPAVDADGKLLGVVAVTADRTGFCGT